MRFLRCFAALLVLAIGIFICSGCSDDAGGGSAQAGKIKNPCPIMPTKEIQEQYYADYEGKRYYFCCQVCVAQFKQNPARWLPLIQKAQSSSESETNQSSP